MAGFHIDPGGILQVILDPERPLSELKEHFRLTRNPDGTDDLRVLFCSDIRYYHVWQLYWMWRMAKEYAFAQGFQFSSKDFVVEYIRIEFARVKRLNSFKYFALYVLTFIDSIFYTFFSMVMQWVFSIIFLLAFILIVLTILLVLFTDVSHDALPIDIVYYFTEHLKFFLYMWIVWVYVSIVYYVVLYFPWKGYYKTFEDQDREAFRAKYLEEYNKVCGNEEGKDEKSSS